MDINLGVRTRNSCSDGQPLVEGVQVRETRSSYFLNLNLQGFKKDDIQLEMDSERSLIIRGQRYSQETGMLRWTWRLVDNGGPIGSRRRRPFTIPQDVNVGAIRDSFHQGVLHVVLPKFRNNSFSPYNIHIHSSCDPPHQSQNEEETNKMGDKIAGMENVQQNVDMEMQMEMEMLLPGPEEGDDMSTVITMEEHCREVPDDDCPSSAQLQTLLEENVLKKQEHSMEEKYPEKEIVAQEAKKDYSPSQEKQGTPPSEEEKEKEKERERHCEKRNAGRVIKHPKPFFCKGLSHILSSIAVIVRRNLGCH